MSYIFRSLAITHHIIVGRVYIRVRDIQGNILATLTERPSETIFVPSLGFAADNALDAHGQLPSTIARLHSAYISVRKTGDQSSVSERGRFVALMASSGMAAIEAAYYWSLIDSDIGIGAHYRERINLEL